MPTVSVRRIPLNYKVIRRPLYALALEVGGGQGGLTALLYPQAQITNIHLDPKYADVPCHQQEKVRFICGDATNLPFENESFDAVTMFEVLKHIPDHQKAVSEALRVLKPKGFLLVSSPN
ncbi:MULTISPECIES: class I SAM-dependent methyltransferase [unclassified Microcoleus]|uniref:class I SAM-dependent methyltransferase n=1 Tax=unclassified Microcoleus TaxID=2642155 RepID=UPI002FD2CAB7